MRIEGTDFVDTDFRTSSGSLPRPAEAHFQAATAAGRAPTREELDDQLTATQQELVRLREAQNQLERAKSAVEEMRRRRAEFQTGREEMLHSLIRGVGLLDQSEQSLRRDSQQIGRTLEDLKTALTQVQSLNEQVWTDSTWETDLSRSLATIENARMEYTKARLSWPILEGQGAIGASDNPPLTPASNLADLSKSQLARVGLALNWPVLLLALGVFALTVVIALKR